MTLLEQNRKHQQTHRNKLKSQLGMDEYKRQRAEFMKLYRAQRKEKEFKDLKPAIKPIELPSINITSTKNNQKD